MAALLSAVALLVGTVHGQVTRGPITPTCKVGVPCNAPARGVVLAFWRDGRMAARTSVDAAGRYTVRLAAGTYVVRQLPEVKIGGLRPQRVRVVAGTSERVDFFIDTGIR